MTGRCLRDHQSHLIIRVHAGFSNGSRGPVAYNCSSAPVSGFYSERVAGSNPSEAARLLTLTKLAIHIRALWHSRG